MDLSSLQNGIWKLKKDVINPSGKKNCKHNFWKRLIWNAGTLFVVEPWIEDYSARVIRRVGQYDNQLLIAKNKTIAPLLPELEYVPPETYSTILLYARESIRQVKPDEILKELYDGKRINLGDIQRVIRKLQGAI